MRYLAKALAILLVTACAADPTLDRTAPSTAPTTATTTTTNAVPATTSTGATTTTIPEGPVDAVLLPPLPLQMIRYDGTPDPTAGFTMSLFTGSPLRVAIGAVNGLPANGCIAIALYDPTYTSTSFSGYLELGSGGCAHMRQAEGPTEILPLALSPNTAIAEIGDPPEGPYIPTFQVESPDGGEGWYSFYQGPSLNPADIPAVTSTYAAVLGGDLFMVEGWDQVSTAPLGDDGQCRPTDHMACLGRFGVEAQGTDGEASAPGTAIAAEEDAATFWFFEPAHNELIVKVINGCSINGRFWVFAAGLTQVDVVITVTDTTTGVPKAYQRVRPPSGMVMDTEAFATCP